MKLQSVIFGITVLALVGGAYAIAPANQVWWVSETRYDVATAGASASDVTEGGNITVLNIAINNQTTDRWAGYLGNVVDNVTGGIVLANANAANIFYHWTWDTAEEAVVCAGQGQSYTWDSLADAAATDIDAAWSFADASDDAEATFDDTAAASVIIAGFTSGTTSADTGLADGFETIALDDGTAAESDFLFCVNTDMAGATNGYDSSTVDYELIVPTTSGSTETYYFYVEVK